MGFWAFGLWDFGTLGLQCTPFFWLLIHTVHSIGCTPSPNDGRPLTAGPHAFWLRGEGAYWLRGEGAHCRPLPRNLGFGVWDLGFWHRTRRSAEARTQGPAPPRAKKTHTATKPETRLYCSGHAKLCASHSQGTDTFKRDHL